MMACLLSKVTEEITHTEGTMATLTVMVVTITLAMAMVVTKKGLARIDIGATQDLIKITIKTTRQTTLQLVTFEEAILLVVLEALVHVGVHL